MPKNYRPTSRPMICVIPCGGDKVDHVAPARDLYTSSTFKLALAAAQAEVDAYDGPARVLILSAKHGLVDPATVLAPYDLRMGQTGSVTAAQVTSQAVAHGIGYGDDVYAFLPASYFKVLDEALRALDVVAAPVYEATAGVGDQRHVCVVVRDADDTAAVAA